MTLHIKARLSALLLCLALPAQASDPMHYEDQSLSIRLLARTPEQLSAFYQGRQFPPGAIEALREACFITPLISNKSTQILWLELDNWRFSAGTQTIARITREDWQKKWKSIALAQAQQATFGWTLLPETRNLFPDEHVGGAITLPRQAHPVTLVARFHTNQDKQGPLKSVTFNNINCTGNSVHTP